MKKKLSSIVILLFIFTLIINAQKSEITIKGSVEFPDNRHKVKIFYPDKFERIVIDSFTLNTDNSFEKRVKLPFPGVYYIDCQKWEILRFWGENEDIEVNFRGQDTAKVKIKNPPYEHIENAGKNNELINWLNYFDYMSYQMMIATGKDVYNAGKSNCDEWKEYMKDGYKRNNEMSRQFIDYLARHYTERNSVLAILPSIKDATLKNKIITYFEQNKPNYLPYIRFKNQEAERLAQMKKLSVGSKAPNFKYQTPDSKEKIGPYNFRGKYLLLDFWASWCGPCRKAIPQLKKIYAKYQEMGFEILSVSIDGKNSDWKQALKQENMPWKQICAPDSGKGIMSEYQFNGIPHLVLIDKDGKIIKRGFNSEELEKMLSNILESKN